MAQVDFTKIKISLGALQVEYEGHEGFLKGSLPALLQELSGLPALNLAGPLCALQAAAASAIAAQAEAAAELESLKKDVDTLGDLSTEEQMRLQMAMDRLSKTMSTLSNILKKIDDTASAIAANFK